MRTLEAARPSGRSGERHGVPGIACCSSGWDGLLFVLVLWHHSTRSWPSRASGPPSSGLASPRLRKGAARAIGCFAEQKAPSCRRGPFGGYLRRRATGPSSTSLSLSGQHSEPQVGGLSFPRPQEGKARASAQCTLRRAISVELWPGAGGKLTPAQRRARRGRQCQWCGGFGCGMIYLGI